MSYGSVVTDVEMAACSRRARDRGEMVVFTNGCFDLLHLGHVRYLHAARALGTMLFVGVNSDQSARSLKGSDRPYNSEQDRAQVLAALGDVSLVTVFDQTTADELVEAVQPAIYVKGGDYSADPTSPSYPIEAKTVTGYRGVVRIIPYTPGYSTSNLIQRIHAGNA